MTEPDYTAPIVKHLKRIADLEADLKTLGQDNDRNDLLRRLDNLHKENARLKGELEAAEQHCAIKSDQIRELSKASFDYEHWQTLAKSNGDQCLALETALVESERSFRHIMNEYSDPTQCAEETSCKMDEAARAGYAAIRKARGGE